jgi:hypothetical protein
MHVSVAFVNTYVGTANEDFGTRCKNLHTISER